MQHNKKYGYLFFLLMLLFNAKSIAEPLSRYPFSLPAEKIRFETLTKEIRCVVCQHQSLADSEAPLANDLRDKIYQMILAKKSDAEIKDYLVKRYGEFILLRPRFTGKTFMLWMFPFLGLTTVLLWGLRYLLFPKTRAFFAAIIRFSKP